MPSKRNDCKLGKKQVSSASSELSCLSQPESGFWGAGPRKNLAFAGHCGLRLPFPKVGLQKPLEGEGNVGLPHQEAVLAFFSGSDLGKSPSRSTSPNYILTGSPLGITPSRELWRALGDHWWVVEMLGHAGLFRKAEDLTLLSQ